MTTTYVKKNGEVCVYKYEVDSKKYNATWYEKHKEDIKNNRINCPCGLSYLGTNKSNHSKGRVHQMYLKYTEILNQEE